MKKVLAILAFATAATFAMGLVTAGIATSTGAAGSAAPTVDVLGAHNNYGRGCAGCHAPHSGARGNGNTTTDAQSGMNALFGQDYSALYGQTLNFGDISPTATGNKYQLVTPASGTTLGSLTTQQYSDLRGIIMCLACHDGNVAKGAMMQNNAYENQIGALPTSYKAGGTIPTLLSNSGAGYNNDHPVGEQALVSAAMGATYATVYVNGVLTVASAAASTQYAAFISSYGAPALLPGAHGSATPAAATAGQVYVVCTTCHNQHVMNVYAASATNPVNAKPTGTYATYFFINGPYNVNDVTLHPTSANSTTQFCRQCHFGESNEANGGTLPTTF